MTLDYFSRKQPEADKLKNKFNEKENEEKLPWHDVSDNAPFRNTH